MSRDEVAALADEVMRTRPRQLRRFIRARYVHLDECASTPYSGRWGCEVYCIYPFRVLATLASRDDLARLREIYRAWC